MDSSLICTHCSAQFSNKHDLKTHISSQHGHHMPFTCTLCGKGYQTAMGLTYHKRAHEGTSYPCPLCNSRLTQRSSMRAHLKSIHSVAQCATCSGIFTVGQEYNQHVLHCVSQHLSPSLFFLHNSISVCLFNIIMKVQNYIYFICTLG